MKYQLKRILFRLGAVVLTLAIFGGMKLTLRWFGIRGVALGLLAWFISGRWYNNDGEP